MFFQLGGHASQLKWTETFWDETALVELVAGPASPLKKKSPNGDIELVLGLKSSGASHLLISGDDAREISLANRLPYPNPASAYSAYDFESVSPIVFANKEGLSQKMKHLRQKKGGAPSQANRNYPDGTLDLYRGAFEHGRLLYQILNQTVNPLKYGVDDTSWTSKTRLLSFVFNVKEFEGRNSVQRKLFPDVLDFGLCEAFFQSMTPNVATAKHIINRKNKLLGRRQPKRTFNYGVTEEIAFEDVAQRIKSFFQDHESTKSSNPIILLVCKEEESLNLLRNMGVDTAAWRSGIRDLFLPDSGARAHASPVRQQGPSHSRKLSYSGGSYTPARQSRRSRSRSMSPGRHRDSHWRHGSTSTSVSSQYQTDSPATVRQSYAPVYVLDVRELYVKLMQARNVRGAADIARLLKLTDEEGWCAGNEAATIINVWKEMISSLPIDDQRELRKTFMDPDFDDSSPERTPEPEAYKYNSDDDRDPNEIVAQPQKGNTSKDKDPYAFDESDWDSD